MIHMVQVGFAKQDLEAALRPVLPVREERIEAIGLYLSSDCLQCVWITLDFMDFDLHVIKTLTAAVQKSTGIDPMHIHIVTTHNHGGGEPDLDVLSELAAQCAQNAMQNAAPAKIRWVCCKTDRQLNIIRRYPVPELGGVNTMYYGACEQNGFDSASSAQYAIEAVRSGRLSYSGQAETTRPAAPLPSGDDEIFAMQFCDDAEKVLGTVVRFAAHAVCCNLDGSYSSDYPYHVRRGMEDTFGGICLFWNGPCGDIAPAMTAKTDGTQRVLGEQIAQLAASALRSVPYSPIHTFRDTAVSVPLPVRQEVRTGSVILPDTMPDPLPQRRMYLETRLLAELMGFLQGKYRNGEPSPGDTISVSLGFLQLNDLLFTAFPGETFSVTGKALQDAFPDKSICTVTEHGRTVMYLPPDADCKRGGYESVCRTTEPHAEHILRSGAITAAEVFLH